MATARLIKPFYSIYLKIGDVDVSMRVQSVAIINNIEMVFPAYYLTLDFSSKDYASNKMYGNEDVYLKILKNDENGRNLESTELHLMILDMTIPFTTKADDSRGGGSSSSSQSSEDPFTMICAPKEAFKMFGTPINHVHEQVKSSGETSIGPPQKIPTPGSNISGITDKLQSIGNVMNGAKSSISGILSNVKSDPTLKNDKYLLNKLMELQNGLTYSFTNGSKSELSGVVDSLKGLSSQYGGGVTAGLSSVIPSMENMLSNEGSAQSFLPMAAGMGDIQNSGKIKENTPLWVVKNMFEKYYKNNIIKLNIKPDNLNEKEMMRCVIPPMSISKSINYINDNYGVYKGQLFKHCNIKDEFCIWDLSKIMDAQQEYTVEFLNISEPLPENPSDNTIFTYSNLNMKNRANTSMIEGSYENIIVAKPMNKFYKTIVAKLDDQSDNVAGDGDKSGNYNDAIKTKKNIYTKNVTGFQNNDHNSFFTSKLSKSLAKSNSFDFELDKPTLTMEKLTAVGIPIQLKPHLTEYINYQGKYIVSSSIMTISRETTSMFYSQAAISCFRFNTEY